MKLKVINPNEEIKKEKTVYLRLIENPDSVGLFASTKSDRVGYILMRFYNNGTIERVGYLVEELGFKLDDLERVIIL